MRRLAPGRPAGQTGNALRLQRTGALLLALLAAALAHGESFLPPGALKYEETRLANGLRIVVQRVKSAPYVSARLVTRTGTDHYPCEDRELPHLVEHLLFSANGELAENDIDEQVNGWGGSINAYTYDEQTDIVLDVHSRYQADAVRLLATMIGGFAPEQADVAREAEVVERESGVDHTPLRMWWSRQPAVQLASTKFSLAAGIICAPGLVPVHHLDAADVKRAFDAHYVPANMILVLVGDLSDAGIAAAADAFGALPARPPAPVTAKTLQMPAGNEFVSGWLSGTADLDRPSALALGEFRDWEGYYALLLVESWLNDRMFRDLRSERGIAYTPSAGVNYHGSALSVVLAVETEARDTAFTREYLHALVEEVRTRGLPAADFERLRQATLLSMAQSFERIADRADYLADSAREIDDGGLFDSETFYEQLDYVRFSALVARDWPQHFVVIDDSPRVSWAGRIGLLTGCVLLLLGAIGWRTWQRLRDARPG